MTGHEILTAAALCEAQAAGASRRGARGGVRGTLERAAVNLRASVPAGPCDECQLGEHVHDPDGSPCLCCGQVSA